MCITAIDKVREISNVEKINTLGFCIGGTLLSCAAGVIAKQKRDTINSITLMASLLEFSDPGILKIFIDESSISMRGKLNRTKRCHAWIGTCINLFIFEAR
ncbi:MAG: hypothetical protein CM15mP58_17870 [Burkholderiaceae bacterium]|nr:MAG: hypothetical protein CM15mP58_17870 [Burkholderiaceae bacterium]